MSRLILTAVAALLIATPVAQAQGVSLGATNRTSTGGFPGAGGYYNPGFGYSTYPMRNNNGYYGGYGYGNYGYGGYGAPVYSAPVAVPGLSGQFRIGNGGINYWRGPSGYYYPWGGGGTTFVQQSPIYVVEEGRTQQQLPPVSKMLQDLETYLGDSQKNGQIADAQYNRLFQRLQDLRSKYDHELSAGGGILDPGDEQNIRIDVSNLGGEVARAVKPMSNANTKQPEIRNY